MSGTVLSSLPILTHFILRMTRSLQTRKPKHWELKPPARGLERAVWFSDPCCKVLHITLQNSREPPCVSAFSSSQIMCPRRTGVRATLKCPNEKWITVVLASNSLRQLGEWTVLLILFYISNLVFFLNLCNYGHVYILKCGIKWYQIGHQFNV